MSLVPFDSPDHILASGFLGDFSDSLPSPHVWGKSKLLVSHIIPQLSYRALPFLYPLFKGMNCIRVSLSLFS